MKVAANEPFRIIYSILNHEYLGYLLEAFVVQLTPKGELSYLYQTVSATNCGEFIHGLDEADLQLIKLIDAIQQDVVLKKFNPKKLKPLDFFLRIYDAQKGDKLLQEAIAGYLDTIKARLMPLLHNKQLFIMGNDGNPRWQEVEVLPEKATVLFHFMRNIDNTHYFPTIRYQGQKVEFQYKQAFIVSDDPAWLVCGNKLYHFAKDVDGKKLRPFLNKKFIVIPKNIEEDYYKKFVSSIITQFDVFAKGFEIKSEAYPCLPLLSIAETQQMTMSSSSLFDTSPENQVETSDRKVVFNLSFAYGDYTFRFDSFSAPANVSMEKQGDDFVFHKVRRDLAKEKEKVRLLKEWGLDLPNGRAALEKATAFDWLHQHYHQLREAGFHISQQQTETDKKRYFLGYSSLELSIHEGNDWFDIYAIVRFGEYEMPFLRLKDLILRKKREFTLPNGEVAVIPEAWFAHYAELFAFVETDDEQNRHILKKYHVSLVQDLAHDNLASVVMSRKLEQLRDFQKIEDAPMPKGFKGKLRPYQKAGYDWMYFLNRYSFGGCLADDMGLGKTVQALALLQSQKEHGVTEPSLLVMPTSLIYNWLLEAARFTPQLRVLVYTGTYRDKNPKLFDHYDLVLTSYGIVRIDVDILQHCRFNYIILDESQAIKNPSSNIAKAVIMLNAKHRLILTGTPLENSTMDLWSQMSFVNPGLLGGQAFFKNEFLLPIEKHNDEKKTQRLYHLIKPFMLRRHKSQVATELPPKIESVQYCEMAEEQEREYEEAKSYYRNMILQHIEDEGISKSQMMVLQGLTKLRQIANHPRLVDGDYEGESGKLTDVLRKMETVIKANHKILIFSQFVKHLAVFREHLDSQGTPYAYLDGSTYDRQEQVTLFQNDESIKIFLISLKAGGLGLNLTAAEYVFILDPWWNPAIESQAIDRAHRIGQEKTVFTYKFISKNTVEEKILALQKSKLRLADSLITTEETFVKSLSKSDVMALLA